MPVDHPCLPFREDPQGTEKIVKFSGEVVWGTTKLESPNDATGVGYHPHFANCPEYEAHRHDRTKPKPLPKAEKEPAATAKPVQQFKPIVLF